MTDWLKKALTRKITIKTTQKHKPKTITIQPNPKLIIGIKFTISKTITLTILQIAHMTVLHTWNSKIFACISGLIATVREVLISQHA
jgi:hypothetical protein